MTVTETKYVCDICKAEVSESKDLLSVVLPYETYIDTTISLVSWKPSGRYANHEIEACQKCAAKISNKLEDLVLIEDIPYHGLTITTGNAEREE